MEANRDRTVQSRLKFRMDLELFQDPTAVRREDIVLKDPVTDKYFRLTPYEYRLLQAFDGALDFDEVLNKLKEKGHYYRADDARQIVTMAAQLGLVLGTRFGTSLFQSHLKKQQQRARRSAQFSRIYFLYIPLLNPDRFLEKTVWIFEKVTHRATAGALLLLAAGSIYLLASSMHRLEQEFLFFFSLRNFVYLWITIALTKLVHELAHAYAAKSLGLHVPTMGVAFLIFLPRLYCDTTDAWQLAQRRQRMAISAAGIIAEGMVAVLATYVWYFTLPGVVNSLAYYLVAVSFISTVLFNANPLMRWDGYFILADFLRIPNLASKSMSRLRYLFMNRVLGITLSANPATTRREATIFTIYGIAAVAYRVFLCVAIVVGVYYRFDKLVGIILGGLAGILFLVRPMIRGVKRLYNHRREIHLRPVGGVVFFLVVAALVTVLVIPVTTRAIYPCYLASAKTQKLTVPLETSVATVFIRHGMTVEEGMLLFQLEPTRLDLTVAKKSLERDIVKQQVQLMLLDQQEMAKAGEKQIELALLEKEIALRKKDLDLAQKGIRAPFSGVVTKFDYRLQHGFQPGEGAIVGELASQRDCEVRILVPEEEIDRVRLGAEIEVWFPSGAGYFIAARIQEMRPYSERDLKDSPFSSRLGGEIATEAKDTEHADAPLRAQYVCSAKVQNDKLLALGMTGRCAVLSPPQSILSRLIYSAVQALNRESIL